MAGLTTTKPEMACEKMLQAIGDGLSNLASSDDGEDGEDEDDNEEEPVGGKLCEDDEPGWVTGTISKTVQYRMERLRQKQMRFDEFMQPGQGDTADYFHERDKKHGTTELKFPAVVQPKPADNAASSVPTTFGVPMETLNSVLGKLQMPQVASRQGSTHMRLASPKLQTHEHIPSLPPAPMPNWSPTQQSTHDEPVSFNPCKPHPKPITISKSDSDEDMVTAPALPEE